MKKTSFFDIMRSPSSITVYAVNQSFSLQQQEDRWVERDIAVGTSLDANHLLVEVTAETTPLERIHLRWRESISTGLRFLGDHWERGYGDLEWRSMVPDRIMPWYFLVYDGQLTHGYGVLTQPGACCYWTVDPNGISLWLDVRNGGSGVELGGRILKAAEVVTRQGLPGESPLGVGRALCSLMCDEPVLRSLPSYGGNNWYYAYGKSDQHTLLEDAQRVSDVSPDVNNRPFMVVDAGWQPYAEPPTDLNNIANIIGGGPYDQPGPNKTFPDMPGLAAGMRARGAQPGIWIRPFVAGENTPDSLLLPVHRATEGTARMRVLDPSRPEVIEQIANDFHLLHSWGYDLIKHDWSSCDIFGRWGFQMGSLLTNPGWHFADRTRTTAEIIRAAYQAMRAGAGNAIIIGCCAVSQISAGFFDLFRSGDDTSGRDWDRTRKMGVNSLAFRMAQHETFYAADPDCVGLTPDIPWDFNRQWMDLVARSGTPLFVSIDPGMMGPEQVKAMKAAFSLAAKPRPVGEPLDWLESTTPRAWRLEGEVVHFDWFGETGVETGK
jgi:alpha-galactosidase